MSAFAIIIVLAFLGYLYYLDKKPTCMCTNAHAKAQFLKEWKYQGCPSMSEDWFWDFHKAKAVKCDKCGKKFLYNPINAM